MARASSVSSRWVDPPFPEHGDEDKKTVWASIGQALSAWARFDQEFGGLFSAFVVPDFAASDRWIPQLGRAYGAIRTFEARQDMVRAAGEAYFSHFDLHFEEGKKQFREILREAKEAGRVRNNIAHGEVKLYPIRTKWLEYCLFPSFFDTTRRDKDNVAEFIYNSQSITKFSEQFSALCPIISSLSSSIVDRKKTLRQRFPLRPPW